jgi:hypothetical protein
MVSCAIICIPSVRHSSIIIAIISTIHEAAVLVLGRIREVRR